MSCSVEGRCSSAKLMESTTSSDSWSILSMRAHVHDAFVRLALIGTDAGGMCQDVQAYAAFAPCKRRPHPLPRTVLMLLGAVTATGPVQP